MSGDLHVVPALCPAFFLILLFVQQLLQLMNGMDQEVELSLAQLQLQGEGPEGK